MYDIRQTATDLSKMAKLTLKHKNVSFDSWMDLGEFVKNYDVKHKTLGLNKSPFPGGGAVMWNVINEYLWHLEPKPCDWQLIKSHSTTTSTEQTKEISNFNL